MCGSAHNRIVINSEGDSVEQTLVGKAGCLGADVDILEVRCSIFESAHEAIDAENEISCVISLD